LLPPPPPPLPAAAAAAAAVRDVVGWQPYVCLFNPSSFSTHRWRTRGCRWSAWCRLP
jgi:hypothetical protein